MSVCLGNVCVAGMSSSSVGVCLGNVCRGRGLWVICLCGFTN